MRSIRKYLLSIVVLSLLNTAVVRADDWTQLLVHGLRPRFYDLSQRQDRRRRLRQAKIYARRFVHRVTLGV